MKKLLIVSLAVLIHPVWAQQTIKTTRTTHLLKVPNQATFDHGQTVPANTDLYVWAFESDYYRVRHKFAEYYVFYPYFDAVAGMDTVTNRIVENAPRIKNYKKPPTRYSGAAGRTIYTGPRGGRYYINKNGNKTYIKQ